MSNSPPEVDRAAGSRAAVAARRARAELKRRLRDGEVAASAVLRLAETEPVDQAAASLRVRELLGALAGIGPTKTERVMSELGIAETKRLGGLGPVQRERLRVWLSARERERVPRAARLVVLAGPTAVGKGTVSRHIAEHFPQVLLSVSATTRAPRPGEIDGVHYFFIDDAAFDAMIAAGEFLEWAKVHNAHRYGTPRAPIAAALSAGTSVLLEIDLQGARQVREAMPESLLVFLAPPSWDELVRRLVGRGTESTEEQARRLETARIEFAAEAEFDVTVVNEDVGRAAAEVVDLLVVRPRTRPDAPGPETTPIR